jgi:peptide/nickel transport system ATP-binding protein
MEATARMDATVKGVVDPSIGPTLLDIRDLQLALTTADRDVVLVRDVSIQIPAGAVVGLVGETGAGKSLTAWSTINLLPRGIRRVAGSIVFDGRDLAACSEPELQRIRGSEITMIVQNPKAALLPTRTVGDQLALARRTHTGGTRKQAQLAATEALARVGIKNARQRAHDYPHQLSGGQAQRVVVAMALINQPKLVIADEPTTGLDVTVQAAVLDLMMERVHEHGAALWLITHDLGVIANYTTRTTVMFAGEAVESSSTEKIFSAPQHPYTQGLIGAATLESESVSRERRRVVSGPPPDLGNRPSGCQFAYRCPWCVEACCTMAMPLRATHHDHQVRCQRAEEIVAEEITHAS